MVDYAMDVDSREGFYLHRPADPMSLLNTFKKLKAEGKIPPVDPDDAHVLIETN